MDILWAFQRMGGDQIVNQACGRLLSPLPPRQFSDPQIIQYLSSVAFEGLY